MVLVDVLIALMILGTTATVALRFTVDASSAIRLVHERERELARASAFLDVVALWTRDDLDRRLGERGQGSWRLRIERPVRRLYLIELRDGATREVLLRSALFRAADEAP